MRDPVTTLRSDSPIFVLERAVRDSRPDEASYV